MMRSAVAAVLAVLCGSAHSFTGNDLFKMMQDEDLSSKTAVTAYLRGFIDASAWQEYTYRVKDGRQIDGRFFCVPAGATLPQITDLVKANLVENPALRHNDASLFVLGALSRAWPCPAN